MWLRKKSVESGLDKELRYHLQRLIRDFIAEGLDPAEARRRARLEFGGADQIKEECRDVRGHWLRDASFSSAAVMPFFAVELDVMRMTSRDTSRRFEVNPWSETRS